MYYDFFICASLANTTIFYQFAIAFLFPPAACSISGPSLHLIIFTCTDESSTFLVSFLFVFRGAPFGILTVLS